MSETIIQSTDCCNTCESPVVINTPGPQGNPGTPGTNGTNGVNAFTTTTAPFSQPNSGSNVSVSVANSSWMVIGQEVFVATAGYMQVAGITSSVLVSLKNLGYSGNAAPTTVIASTSQVSPSGVQGPQGASGSATLNQLSPTTTKGDLIVDNGANNPNASDVRLAVGTDKKVLHADSSQATGLNWKTIDLTGAGTSLSGALPIGNGGTGQTGNTAAFDALAPSGPAAGDIITYNGTHWVRLAKGTALQVLRVNAGATALEYAAPPQAVLQLVTAATNAFSSISSTIPLDDTIPQKTEGTQLLTLSITPASITSRIRIRVAVQIDANGAPAPIMALFVGTGSDAVAAVVGANALAVMTLDHIYTAGTTSALTFNLRVGESAGGTIYVNGHSAARIFGGVATAWLMAEEYA